MNSLRSITLLVAGCAWFTTASLHADEASDRAALQSIRAHYEQAVNSADIRSLQPYFMEGTGAVVVTGEEVGSFEAFAAYHAKIRDLIGAGGNYTVRVSADKTQLDGDWAWASGTTSDRVGLADGREFLFGAKWTAVCRKVNGGWKIQRLHTSMDPLENVFVQAKVRASAVTSGALGGVLGVILGVVSTLLFARWRRRAR